MSAARPHDPNVQATPPTANDGDDLAQRLAFLELSEADVERLHELKRIYHGHVDQLVETFYQHLFSFEETARLLRDPALVARLKQAQQAHFESMFDAVWNEEYVVRRRRVGDAHALIGVKPQV